MDQNISDMRQKLDKFKSWIQEPRLYIVEDFDAIKNEIDIFAERFMMRASKSKTKSEKEITQDHDKINSNRRQMIDEVEAFEKKIMANMPTNELEAKLAKKLALSIEKLDKKLNELEKKLESKSNSNDNMQKEWPELDYAIDSAIYEYDCALKQKSSVMFINVFLLKKYLNLNPRYDKKAGIIGKRQAHNFGIKQPQLDKGRDEDEVEINYSCLYFQLDSSTTFGVLFHLDDCIRNEEFV